MSPNASAQFRLLGWTSAIAVVACGGPSSGPTGPLLDAGDARASTDTDAEAFEASGPSEASVTNDAPGPDTRLEASTRAVDATDGATDDPTDGATEASTAPQDSDVADAGEASAAESGAPDAGCTSLSTDGGANPLWYWAQWPMPNEPFEVEGGAPNPESHTDEGDGTVSDDVTGLMWQKSPPTTQYDWSDALTYCTTLTLGGHTDWRLPEYIEIVSIEHHWVDPPALPGAGGPFWSSTPGSAGAAPISHTSAMCVVDSVGSKAFDETLPWQVRCVRAPTPRCATSLADRYAVANGTVYDTMTKLTWERSPSLAAADWSGARAYCAGLRLDGSAGWRLPTLREMLTLADMSRVYESSTPAIDSTAFPGTAPNDFWTATPLYVSGAPIRAWYASFFSGSAGWADYRDVTTELPLRCVR